MTEFANSRFVALFAGKRQRRGRQKWKGLKLLLFVGLATGIIVLLNIFESISDDYSPSTLDSFFTYDDGVLISLAPTISPIRAPISSSVSNPHDRTRTNLPVNISSSAIQEQGAAVNPNQFIPKYIPQSYADELKTSMEPIFNLTTAAYKPNFWSGFCNQYMMFIGMLFLAEDTNSSQILVESIKWKGEGFDWCLDFSSKVCYTFPMLLTFNYHIISMQCKCVKTRTCTVHNILDQFGTNEFIRHDYLFDTVHWNSYYPTLPRIVQHNESIFPDVKIDYGSKKKRRKRNKKVNETINDVDDIERNLNPRLQWQVIGDPFINATRPHPIGKKQTQSIAAYMGHINKVHRLGIDRREIEMEIVGGAFRPHPAIEDMIQEFLFELSEQHSPHDQKGGMLLNDTGQASGDGLGMSSSLPPHHPSSSPHVNVVPYMVLHARIEPDMQKHFACRDRKVVNITHIIDQMYEKFKEPPDNISIMIVILNRALLEKEVEDSSIDNEMATHNLDVLNTMLKDGLWGGKVRVVEAGSNLAKKQSTKYEEFGWFYDKYSTLVGAIINFFLSIDANVFVGTEVSSYSTLVVTSRFFRGGVRSRRSSSQGMRTSDDENEDESMSHNGVVVVDDDDDDDKRRRENYFYTPEGLNWVTPVNATQPPKFQC